MIAVNNNFSGLKALGNVSKNVAKVTGLYLLTAMINKQLKESTGVLSGLATQGFRRLKCKFERN